LPDCGGTAGATVVAILLGAQDEKSTRDSSPVRTHFFDWRYRQKSLD
jgi:hypothetical protein